MRVRTWAPRLSSPWSGDLGLPVAQVTPTTSILDAGDANPVPKQAPWNLENQSRLGLSALAGITGLPDNDLAAESARTRDDRNGEMEVEVGVKQRADPDDKVRSHIVVGVDSSAGATQALDWAATEAERNDSTLSIVVAWAYGGFTTTVLLERDAERIVEGARKQVIERHPGVRVETHVCRDPTANALIEVSRGAELLVVGSRGLGGFSGLLLGSVGQHCLTHAECSVAIIRSAEGRASNTGPGRIVVGVDGSEGSNLALDWAANEACRTNARLDVVTSRIFPAASSYLVAADIGVPDAASQIVGEAVGQVTSVAPEVSVHSETSEEPPAMALVDASRRADMVVLGSRGRGAFHGLLLGSVSQYVANHAHCPVVVVRNHISEPSGRERGE